MSDNTHDPPFEQREHPLRLDEPSIPPESLARLSGPNHEKYQRMRDRLAREPIELIREMKHGGYRFKTRRGMPGVLAIDKGGQPVPDRMSFRQIAPILTGMTGVPVTYETVRRWWETVSDEPDEPDPVPDAPEPEPAPERVRRRRTPVVPPVGDEHADTIRAAVDRAKAAPTNPDVPSAVFLPPAE